MRKILFIIILSVLGICAFISCKEQKHPTIDEEPIIPNGGNNALFGITFNGNNGCHPHDANSAVDYRIDLTEAKLRQELRQELQQELQGLLDRIDALEQELHNLTSTVQACSGTPTVTDVGTTVQACPGTPTVTDVDGNVYPTVRIGEQCWMRDNLRTTRYADGTPIPLGTEGSSTTAYRYYPPGDNSANVAAYRYYPNNNRANVSKYGYLYNWPAVMNGSLSSNSNPSGVQGICPNGWHVPSDAEWTELTNYVSSQSQYVCGSDEDNIAKALASEVGWKSATKNCAVGNNPSTNNATGFSARPAGAYDGYDDGYGGFGYYANFSSATQSNSYDADYCALFYDYAFVIWDNDDGIKGNGYSVRCVRN